MDALEAYHTVDVLTLWIQFETRCPVEKTNQGEENVIYATPFLHVILFCIMFLCRIFTGNQWKALYCTNWNCSLCLKTCCFNCFDKEIKLLPVIWRLVCVSCHFHLNTGWRQSLSVDSRGWWRAGVGIDWAKISKVNSSFIFFFFQDDCFSGLLPLYDRLCRDRKLGRKRKRERETEKGVWHATVVPWPGVKPWMLQLWIILFEQHCKHELCHYCLQKEVSRAWSKRRGCHRTK